VQRLARYKRSVSIEIAIVLSTGRPAMCGAAGASRATGVGRRAAGGLSR